MSRIVFEVEVPSSSEQSEPVSPDLQQSLTPSASEVWTISKLTKQIRFVLENQFRSLMIEGELSNFKRSAQGHLYCQLKDRFTQIRGVMFRQAARTLKFEPVDGMEVVVQGHIAVYEPRGEYQIQISSMEPKGIGSLQLAFEQLKEKLNQEGLFDAEQKQKIPFLPKRIGIVTSPTGAVIHDMIHVLNRRCPTVPVLIFPASVQGGQAVPELIEGIESLNALSESQEIEVLIVGRGGGSLEDLWAFNDEGVARAIFNSKIPVISAVGHETDFTIADFVSDLRAPTPSAAMEMAVPPRNDLLSTLAHHEKRLSQGIKQHFQQRQEKTRTTVQRLRSPDFIVHQHQQRLDDLLFRLHQQIKRLCDTEQHSYLRLRDRLTLLNPQHHLNFQQKNVAGLESRLKQRIEGKLEQIQTTLSQRMELLDSLSPLIVMKRGYGIVLDHSNHSVSSIDTVEIGDSLSIRLQDGTLEALVQKKFSRTI